MTQIFGVTEPTPAEGSAMFFQAFNIEEGGVRFVTRSRDGVCHEYTLTEDEVAVLMLALED